eukprot:scaffold320732_cov32-Tisochrysis_lutea.AAC.1
MSSLFTSPDSTIVKPPLQSRSETSAMTAGVQARGLIKTRARLSDSGSAEREHENRDQSRAERPHDHSAPIAFSSPSLGPAALSSSHLS